MVIKGVLDMTCCLLLFFVSETCKLQDDEEEDRKLCYCPWVYRCGLYYQYYDGSNEDNRTEYDSDCEEVTHKCVVIKYYCCVIGYD